MWHIVKTFLFGGDPSVMTYSISLLFEGIVSAVIVTFMFVILDNHILQISMEQNLNFYPYLIPIPLPKRASPIVFTAFWRFINYIFLCLINT
jgi:hypothetical protein